jgi:hypothetical protein
VTERIRTAEQVPGADPAYEPLCEGDEHWWSSDGTGRKCPYDGQPCECGKTVWVSKPRGGAALTVERHGLRWYWRFYHSGYGYADGYCWTRRKAKRRLRDAIAWYFTEGAL